MFIVVVRARRPPIAREGVTVVGHRPSEHMTGETQRQADRSPGMEDGIGEEQTQSEPECLQGA